MAVALDGKNPGGILDGAFARGQHGYTGRIGPYAAFRTLADGVNAMRVLLTGYIHRGFDTPLKIANKWAPAPDGSNAILRGNDPTKYAERIASALHIKPTEPIPDSKAMLLTLTMANIENKAFPPLWAKEQAHA